MTGVHHLLRNICVIMHIFLLIIHLGLLVIRHFELERRIQQSTSKGITALSITKTVVSQGFAIVGISI
jgi:hypothetical protein